MRRSVRALLVAALLVPAAGLAVAQQGPPPQGPPQAPLPPNGWRIDRSHSGVTFRVRHLGISWVNGSFGEWTADLVYDPARPEQSSVTARIQIASVNTGNERRDADLRSGRFFAADSFPEMTFASRRVERVGPSRLRITGDLTIRGVTREVVLDAEMTDVMAGQRSRRVAFTATTTIDRKDWGMTFSPVAEGIRSAGDEVRITIDIEAVQPITS